MVDLVSTLVNTAIKLVQEGYKLEAQNQPVQISENFDIRTSEGHYKGAVSVAPGENVPGSIKTPVYGVTISTIGTALDDNTEGMLAIKLNAALRGLGLDHDPFQTFRQNSMTVTYTKP